MDFEQLEEILAKQSPSGAFPSLVKGANGDFEDENCFVTASMVLELIFRRPNLPLIPKLSGIIERSLDFLETCEDSTDKGAFCFYPLYGNTPKLPISLNPDLDDSALVWLALLLGKRRSAEEALRAVVTVFEKARLFSVNGRHPNWVKPGCFQTWLHLTGPINPFDCCVNINVAALYYHLGEQVRASCQAAVRSIIGAVKSFGSKWPNMSFVAPYYAHPIELYHALKRAVHLGAAALEEALELLEGQEWCREIIANENEQDTPICCNDWGQPRWYAPDLHSLRRLYGSHLQTMRMVDKVDNAS